MAANICAGDTVGNTRYNGGAPYTQQILRSQQWSILLPRLECNLVKLSDVADSEFASMLASSGLHHEITQYVHLQQAVTSKDIRISFQRSLANIHSIHVTLWTPPFAAPCLNGDDNAVIASFMRAFNKEANFLWSGREYIIKKTHPERRGQVAANGVPAQSVAVATNAQAYALDNQLASKPTSFLVQFGAKRYPSVEISNAETVMQAKNAAGITTFREGMGQMESASTTRKVWSLSFEKILNGNLDGMGASSRSGEGCTVVMSAAGTEDGSIVAEKIYVTLFYSQKLEIRTGSVDKKLAEDSQPEKGMLASGTFGSCEVPRSWKTAKRMDTTALPKGSAGPRRETVPNGENSIRRWQSASEHLRALLQAYGAGSETERVSGGNDGLAIPIPRKVQSMPRPKGGENVKSNGLSSPRTQCAGLTDSQCDSDNPPNRKCCPRFTGPKEKSAHMPWSAQKGVYTWDTPQKTSKNACWHTWGKHQAARSSRKCSRRQGEYSQCACIIPSNPRWPQNARCGTSGREFWIPRMSPAMTWSAEHASTAWVH